MVKIGGYSEEDNVVLLFNRLITEHSLNAEKLETIFTLLLELPNTGNDIYCRILLIMDDEHSVHHDHI